MQTQHSERHTIRLSDQYRSNGNNGRQDRLGDREGDEPPKMGDAIASITKAVGIKPCGPCAKRQAALNRATPGWVAKILGWFKR
jgi:hypothetical protein